MVADPFSALCARGFASLRQAQLHLANTTGMNISLEVSSCCNIFTDALKLCALLMSAIDLSRHLLSDMI